MARHMLALLQSRLSPLFTCPRELAKIHDICMARNWNEWPNELQVKSIFHYSLHRAQGFSDHKILCYIKSKTKHQEIPYLCYLVMVIIFNSPFCVGWGWGICSILHNQVHKIFGTGNMVLLHILTTRFSSTSLFLKAVWYSYVRINHHLWHSVFFEQP